MEAVAVETHTPISLILGKYRQIGSRWANRDKKLGFSIIHSGYEINLPDADDGIDTVIRLIK